MEFIDFHCDTLFQLVLPGGCGQNLKENGFAVDLRRLKQQKARAQFFAIFMIPEEDIPEIKGIEKPQDEEYIKINICRLVEELNSWQGPGALAKSWKDLEENQRNGVLSAFLTLEDGRAVQGKMENLKRFKEMGISLITLTWNEENCFGYPSSADGIDEKPPYAPGGIHRNLPLKPFGKEALPVMNDLGMIIDVSHLNDGGFWDAIQISKKPIIASHSNCRSLCAHPRNLTDEMIRALGEKGGIQGVNFCPDFLAENNPQRDSTLDMLLAHIRHMSKIGGMELPALGTDFDGITGNLEISHVGQLPLLFDGMKKSGFSEEEIEKIAWKNAERVIRDCC